MPRRGKQLHSVEVDQSGKVEDTRVDTVLAFSDGISSSLRISARDKRMVWLSMKRSGPKTAGQMIDFFAVLLFLLLREHTASLATIVIDVEYAGKETEIKRRVLNRFRSRKADLEADRVRVGRIGKKSNAHLLALSVFRGKRKPTQVIRAGEVSELLN